MNQSQQISHSQDVKFLTPEATIELVRQKKVIYIEFEELIYFHHTLIKILEMLRSKGMPIILHIRSIDNNIFSLAIARVALTHFNAVSYIVDDKNGQFSLAHSELSLNSNTYFFGKDINAHSEELIEKRRSFYHASLKSVSISFPKYLTTDKLFSKITEYQEKGKRVAIVTGIFDVLHPGHISFLEKAKNTADILIVLINSDLSTNHQPKNRYHDRPVHRLHERLSVLNALKIVTHIVSFDTDTAQNILQNLPTGIIYVKTVKDKERKSIQKEMSVVKKNGGKVSFISNLRNKSGSVISSTMLIDACRKKADSDVISLEKDLALYSQKKMEELLIHIRTWDKSTGNLIKLREELRCRYDGSLKTAISVENDTISQINQYTEAIILSLPEKRDYYWYVIPYLIGKILDLPIKVIPVQYNRLGQPTDLINVFQRLGGKAVFFNTKTKKVTNPIVFEKHYWFVDDHFQFVPYNNKYKSFVRIFTYPPRVHFSTISLKIMTEEYAHAINDQQMIAEEITKKSADVWEYFETIPFNAKYKDKQIASNFPRYQLPRIVAHGGAAVVSKSKTTAENSATGIKYALEAGIDAVEIDVNACKDGWVVLHEQDLRRETETNGLAADFTESQLKKMKLTFSKGKPSAERIITLTEAIKLVAKYKKNSNEPIVVKIDIKSTNPNLEKKLVEILRKSGIPLQKILITSKIVSCSRRIHQLCSGFAFEFNAVDTNLLVLAYNLIDKNIMLSKYVDYFVYYAPFLSSRVVSLAQFVINAWGDEITKDFIHKLHAHNFQVHVWVATSEEEFFKNATLGADYVQLQDPSLITSLLKKRKKYLVQKR